MIRFHERYGSLMEKNSIIHKLSERNLEILIILHTLSSLCIMSPNEQNLYEEGIFLHKVLISVCIPIILKGLFDRMTHEKNISFLLSKKSEGHLKKLVEHNHNYFRRDFEEIIKADMKLSPPETLHQFAIICSKIITIAQKEKTEGDIGGWNAKDFEVSYFELYSLFLDDDGSLRGDLYCYYGPLMDLYTKYILLSEYHDGSNFFSNFSYHRRYYEEICEKYLENFRNSKEQEGVCKFLDSMREVLLTSKKTSDHENKWLTTVYFNLSIDLIKYSKSEENTQILYSNLSTLITSFTYSNYSLDEDISYDEPLFRILKSNNLSLKNCVTKAIVLLIEEEYLSFIGNQEKYRSGSRLPFLNKAYFHSSFSLLSKVLIKDNTRISNISLFLFYFHAHYNCCNTTASQGAEEDINKLQKEQAKSLRKIAEAENIREDNKIIEAISNIEYLNQYTKYFEKLLKKF